MASTKYKINGQFVDAGLGVAIESTPTAGSAKVVTSEGIKTYVDNGLSAKQDTLVSGTNIKTVQGQSIVGSGNIVVGSNRNLLDNPFFTIDQRSGYIYSSGLPYADNSGTQVGTTSSVLTINIGIKSPFSNDWAELYISGVRYWGYIPYAVRGYTGAVYGVDRWKGGNPITVTVNTDKTITVTHTSTGGYYLSQTIENAIPSNTTITASIIYKATGRGGILRVRDTNNTTYGNLEIEASSDFIMKTFTVSAPNDINSFEIRPWDGNSVTVKAVKLELGSVSTLANDVAPNYAEELAKCQRYYFKQVGLNGAAYHCVAVTNSALCTLGCLFPVNMRTNPTVTVLATRNFLNNVTEAITYSTIGSNNTGIEYLVTSTTLTVGNYFNIDFEASADL